MCAVAPVHLSWTDRFEHHLMKKVVVTGNNCPMRENVQRKQDGAKNGTLQNTTIEREVTNEKRKTFNQLYSVTLSRCLVTVRSDVTEYRDPWLLSTSAGRTSIPIVPENTTCGCHGHSKDCCRGDRADG